MQSESEFASSLSEEIGIEEERAIAPFQARNYTSAKIPPKTVSKQRESKRDIVSAAVVVGMTAQFVVFIFGLVTEFMPRMLDTILLSVFVGLCVCIIAFALMKGDD